MKKRKMKKKVHKSVKNNSKVGKKNEKNFDIPLEGDLVSANKEHKESKKNQESKEHKESENEKKLEVENVDIKHKKGAFQFLITEFITILKEFFKKVVTGFSTFFHKSKRSIQKKSTSLSKSMKGKEKKVKTANQNTKKSKREKQSPLHFKQKIVYLFQYLWKNLQKGLVVLSKSSKKSISYIRKNLRFKEKEKKGIRKDVLEHYVEEEKKEKEKKENHTHEPKKDIVITAKIKNFIENFDEETEKMKMYITNSFEKSEILELDENFDKVSEEEIQSTPPYIRKIVIGVLTVLFCILFGTVLYSFAQKSTPATSIEPNEENRVVSADGNDIENKSFDRKLKEVQKDLKDYLSEVYTKDEQKNIRIELRFVNENERIAIQGRSKFNLSPILNLPLNMYVSDQVIENPTLETFVYKLSPADINGKKTVYSSSQIGQYFSLKDLQRRSIQDDQAATNVLLRNMFENPANISSNIEPYMGKMDYSTSMGTTGNISDCLEYLYNNRESYMIEYQSMKEPMTETGIHNSMKKAKETYVISNRIQGTSAIEAGIIMDKHVYTLVISSTNKTADRDIADLTDEVEELLKENKVMKE